MVISSHLSYIGGVFEKENCITWTFGILEPFEILET